MNKILVAFLVFFLLGSNVVQALDSVLPEQPHETRAHKPDAAGVQDQDSDSCDHCCHGAAHFLGILFTGGLVIGRADNQHITTTPLPHTTRAYQPPLPPPNA